MRRPSPPSTEQVTVDKDAVVSPADGISNKDDLPTGTTFAWKPGHAPVTSQPGDTVGTVVVTYPDGTTEEVTVAVHVRSDAENNAPVGNDLTADQGSTLDPSTAIANKGDLPTGATFSWKPGHAPDTSVPGDKTAVVVVTYADGSTDEVTIAVHVNAPAEKPAESPSQTAAATGANKKKRAATRALPKTGDAASFAVLAMGASGSAAAIGAAIKRRKRS